MQWFKKLSRRCAEKKIPWHCVKNVARMVTQMRGVSVKLVHSANGRKGHVSVKRNVPFLRQVSLAKFFSS